MSSACHSVTKQLQTHSLTHPTVRRATPHWQPRAVRRWPPRRHCPARLHRTPPLTITGIVLRIGYRLPGPARPLFSHVRTQLKPVLRRETRHPTLLLWVLPAHSEGAPSTHHVTVEQSLLHIRNLRSIVYHNAMNAEHL